MLRPLKEVSASVNALVTDRSVIAIEQCMDPNNRHVFAGSAISDSYLADFLGDLWRVDHRLPRALQELNEITVNSSRSRAGARQTAHGRQQHHRRPNGGFLAHLRSRPLLGYRPNFMTLSLHASNAINSSTADSVWVITKHDTCPDCGTRVGEKHICWPSAPDRQQR